MSFWRFAVEQFRRNWLLWVSGFCSGVAFGTWASAHL